MSFFSPRSKSAQGSLVTCVDMLSKMMLGTPPQLPAGTRPFIERILSRLQCSCRATVTDGRKKPRELGGHGAILEMCAGLRSKADVKMEGMEPLHVFSFLLSPEDQTAAFAMTHELLMKALGGSAGLAGASTQGGGAVDGLELYGRPSEGCGGREGRRHRRAGCRVDVPWARQLVLVGS